MQSLPPKIQQFKCSEKTYFKTQGTQIQRHPEISTPSRSRLQSKEFSDDFIKQGLSYGPKCIGAGDRKFRSFGSQFRTRGPTHTPLPRLKSGEICMKLLKFTNTNLFQVSSPPVMLLNWGQIGCQVCCPGILCQTKKLWLLSCKFLWGTD